MFEIEYKGANCVIISTKDAKIVVDPKLSEVGLKDCSVKDAVELVTDDDFRINDEDAKLIINTPGEYGISGFDILGIPALRHIDAENEIPKSVMYRVEIGDSRIGIIGNVHYKMSDDQFEQLGVLDILIIPIGGGGYTLDAVNAMNIIKNIEPKVIIPVHYADSGIKYEVPQDEFSILASKLNIKVDEMDKYKFKSSNQPETSSIVKLSRK